jgi:hypothetical protein
MAFSWGEEYELPKKHQDLGFLGNATSGYMQLAHRSHESLSFQKFSPSLHLSSEKEADLSGLPRDYSSEWLSQIGSKYYWFFATYDKGDDKESLYAQELDLETGGMKGAAREVLTSTKLTGTLTATGFYRFALTDKWNFFNSFDRSKILVQYRKKPEHRNDSRSNDVIGFQVFDAEMNKIWGREIRMPYTEEMMDNEDYQVDSRGNVYTLAKMYTELRSRDRKHPNYRFEILKWSADNNEVTKIPFRFTDKFVKTALITEAPDGKMMVGGYYSSRKTGSADGAFLLSIDEHTNELNSVKKGTYEFSASVLKQYESRRAKRRIERKDDKDEAEAENLNFRKMVIGQDGSIEMYGEESYVVVRTYSNGRTTTTTTTYYYEDILAMKIDADGNLRWMTKIPKQQQGSAGVGGLSFKQYNHKGNSYILFMDNKKNLDITPDESPATHADGAGGLLMAVKIDEAGKTSKAQLYDVREERVNLAVTDFDEVGNNQLIVRGRARHRESKAALITFN